MENINLQNPEIDLLNIAKNTIDDSWKDFLFEIINKHNLNPWNLDITLFTKSYLDSIKDLSEMDFNLSGKFLIISVFLLKLKSKELLEKDIKNFEEFERESKNDGEINDEFEDMEFDEENFPTKKNYKINLRNPFSRKKKVSIFDLIGELENTLKKSEIKKQKAFEKKLLKQEKYEGPIFKRKSKELKELLLELFDEIELHLNKMGHLKFSHLINKKKHNKVNILQKFIPLLHLSNQKKN